MTTSVLAPPPADRISLLHPTAPDTPASGIAGGGPDIRPMTDRRDVWDASMLLAQYCRWLLSIGADLATALPDHLDPARFYREPAGFLLVARSGKQPVGVVGVRVHQDRMSARGQDRVAELRRLLVVPEARGRGLGRRLLNAAVDHVHRLGAGSIELEAMPGPMDPALAMLRSAGFTDSVHPARSRSTGFVSLTLSAS